MRLQAKGLRALAGVLLMWFAGGAGVARAEEQRYPESIGEGIVVETDVAAGTMMIEGYRYRFAPDLPVQIGGTASRVDAVAPGMVVQFRYLRVPDDLRELVEIRQVPPGVQIIRP